MRSVKQPQGKVINIERSIVNMDGNIKRTLDSFVSLAIAKGANLRELKAFLQGLVDQVNAKIEEAGNPS